MTFPWTPIAPAQSAPLLRVGFRRHGKIMSTDPLLLVDTGADGVLLNLALAKLMGFHDSDLVTEECKGANWSRSPRQITFQIDFEFSRECTCGSPGCGPEASDHDRKLSGSMPNRLIQR